MVFTYTIVAGQTDANGIAIAANSLALNGGTLKDAAGNDATLTHALVADNGGYLVEAIAPTFSSAATANFAENTAAATTAYDATADGDIGVTYILGGTDATKFNIHASTGVVTFKTSPNYEAPTDSDTDNGYSITVTATDAAGNATNQAVAITVTDVLETGQLAINLGSYGKLIAPVNVDGNWYYYWDRSGDGTCNSTGTLNGGRDYTSHDVLDGIFTQNITGVTGGSGNTTDTYRYATLNGVHVALPTYGGGTVTTGYRSGTVIDNNPAGEANPTYDGLLAIWDGYNGVSTDWPLEGVPPDWQSNTYWSATPSVDGHAAVDLGRGVILNSGDYLSGYVALQVL